MEQQIERIALGREMTPQPPAGSVANAEFFDDGGVPQSPTFQISNRFRSAMKLNLIVGSGLRQQLSGSRGAGPRCQFLLQMRNTLAERHVEEEFHKPNQIAAVPTSVAIEQVLTDVDIKGRTRFLVQRTQAHKLLPGTASARLPVMPLQVFQHREVLFELLQIRVHGVCSSQNEATRNQSAFPGKDGGRGKFL